MKKVISWMLSCAMLLSMITIPAMATEAPTIELNTVKFTANDSTGDLTKGDAVTDLKPGDVIAVEATYTNTTNAAIFIGAYAVQIQYDQKKFEPYKISYSYYGSTQETDPIVHVGPVKAMYSNAASAENGTSTWTGAATGNYFGVQPNQSIPVGYALFKVKSDVESGTYTFAFTNDSDKNYFHVSAANSGETGTASEMQFNDTATGNIIDGVPPTLQTVTLASKSVTVNGTDAQTVQAKATSAKGTDLTNSVTWSIGTPENGGGVSIAENGTITVAANAKAGEYTVYANKNSSGGGGGSGSINRSQSAAARSEVQGSAQATLTVSRETSVAKELAISANQSMVEIPTDDNVATAKFTAAFRDQYREEMTAPFVNWSITPSADGVSINSGVVTVTKDAKNKITNSTEFTITATSGGLTQSSKLIVKRAAAQAKSIELGTVNNMTVPADGADAKTATVTATVKDQYNTQISTPTVEWSISPADKGVSIDNNGKITVTNEAKEYITDTNGKQFTVTAKSADVTNTATVTVKRADSNATSMKVFKGNAELTGNTDTIIIPSTSTDNTYTYSAKVYDQYGSEMTSAQPTLTFANANDKVTYNNGTVTVKKGATKDSTYTLTVSYDGLDSKAIMITAKDIDITWPTVSKKAGTYGDKWSDIVTFSGGSAKLNGTDVSGSFTLKDADDVPDVDATYQFVFKSDDGKYTVESSAYSDATIAKKNLTITAASDSKQYNGQPLTKSDYTVDGLVNGDQATVTVTGSATNVEDNGTNVPSNAVIKNGDAVKTGNYDITYFNGTLTITKAPLTIKANDKTITYGDAANNGGVTYTGLVNSEVGTTVAPVEYEYNYKQYDNIGEYVITPKGATEANYKITYQSGKLTVAQREVTLTWEPTDEDLVLYYDGNAKDVKATVGGTVNGDVITATVVGGKESAIGQYTAKVTALTGDKAGNYKLPATNLEKTYQIKSALNASDLTIDPTTVTATIDGLTIKLVGYKNKDATIEVKAGQTTAVDNKLTVNGVTYTIDASGVKDIETSKIDVKDTIAKVEKAEGANIDDSVVTTINNAATKAEGLNNALADLIARADQNMPDGATKVEVKAILNIQPVSYGNGSLKLNIKP